MNIENMGPSITNIEKKYVMDALNCWYGKDRYKYCELFEEEFAEWHGRKYGIVTNNGTAAIQLALIAYDIGPGDDVIVPDLTWIGSTVGIDQVGAEPVFVDVFEDNWCIDIDSLYRRVGVFSDNIRVIIAVNLYGNMCDMHNLESIAHSGNYVLIEDAAESLGSKLHGQKSGTFGDMSVFSFHLSKTLTMGEGGIILTDDSDIAKRLKMLRNNGRHEDTPLGMIDEITPRTMPSNIACALGYGQLKRIDELIARKREILHFYKEIFSDMKGVTLNEDNERVYNGAWATNIVWDKRYEITKHRMLKKLDFEARPMFYPLSSLPTYNTDIFGNYTKKKYEKFNPVAYDISERGITMPSALNMTNDQVEYCGTKVKETLCANIL